MLLGWGAIQRLHTMSSSLGNWSQCRFMVMKFKVSRTRRAGWFQLLVGVVISQRVWHLYQDTLQFAFCLTTTQQRGPFRTFGQHFPRGLPTCVTVRCFILGQVAAFSSRTPQHKGIWSGCWRSLASTTTKRTVFVHGAHAARTMPTSRWPLETFEKKRPIVKPGLAMMSFLQRLGNLLRTTTRCFKSRDVGWSGSCTMSATVNYLERERFAMAVRWHISVKRDTFAHGQAASILLQWPRVFDWHTGNSMSGDLQWSLGSTNLGLHLQGSAGHKEHRIQICLARQLPARPLHSGWQHALLSMESVMEPQIWTDMLQTAFGAIPRSSGCLMILALQEYTCNFFLCLVVFLVHPLVCHVLTRQCEENPVVLSESQAAEFYQKGMRRLEIYGYLNSLSAAQARVRGHGVLNKALWLLLPKHHHFMHMLEDARICKINPSWYTLLCAESYIGQMGRLARGCHRASLHLRALQRYKLLLALHFGVWNLVRPGVQLELQTRFRVSDRLGAKNEWSQSEAEGTTQNLKGINMVSNSWIIRYLSLGLSWGRVGLYHESWPLMVFRQIDFDGSNLVTYPGIVRILWVIEDLWRRMFGYSYRSLISPWSAFGSISFWMFCCFGCSFRVCLPFQNCQKNQKTSDSVNFGSDYWKNSINRRPRSQWSRVDCRFGLSRHISARW